MPGSHGTLCINSFYPETELNITKIQEYEKQILMRMKSISKDCRCPKCGYITDKYHGTYIRKVQDLPILGKMVQLEICSHEYECINNDCEVTTFAETFDGFLNTYSRMTERCADFICTLKEIYTKGYTGSKSNVFDYLCKIEQKENRYFEVQPYIQTMTEALKYRTGSIGKEKDYITREGIFRYMWMNTELTVAHKNFIYDQYPAVQELHRCIKEFRNIFKKRNIPLLYLFIEKYCKSELKALKSFAEGLKRDIDAIENAVAYDYSNGFVEGTNSRLKMIKRTMYGRCRKRLLEAKLRYVGKHRNG